MFNIGVIGSGRIAKKVSTQIEKTGDFKVVAVYSRTFNNAIAFSDIFNCTAYSSFDRFLKDKNIQAIYIATPHSSHYEYLQKCIKARIPVICEKAFTVNSKQTEEIIKLSKQYNSFVCEAMWTKFNPVVQQIIEWVNSGYIGNVKSVKANFCLPLQVAKKFVSKRVYLPEYAGGALLDLGVYPIAYSYFLLGNPESINASLKIKNNVDINDKITLNYSSGIKAILNSSLNSFKSYLGVIKGDKGVIISPLFYKPKYALILSKSKIKIISCKRSYVYEFYALKKDIENNNKESSIMSLDETFDIMKILDECRKQNNFYYKNIEEL